MTSNENQKLRRALTFDLYEAIQTYNIERVKELLAKGANSTKGLERFVPESYEYHGQPVQSNESFRIIELLLDAGADTENMAWRLLHPRHDNYFDVKLADIFLKKDPEAFRSLIRNNPHREYHHPPSGYYMDTIRRYLWLIINGLITADPNDINTFDNKIQLSQKWGHPWPNLTELEYVKEKMLQNLKNMLIYPYNYGIKDILRNKNLLRFITIYYGKDRVPEILNELVPQERLPNNNSNIFRSNKTFTSRKPLLAHYESVGGRRRKTRRRHKAKK